MRPYWPKVARVKAGNCGQQVNSDIHLQTVQIQKDGFNEPSHQDFHCFLS